MAAIYVLLPKLFDTQNALDKLGDANAIWIAVALAFNVLAFFSYVALFRGVVGEQVLHLEWRESYQITMAGLAATRLFSAGGAGGIVLTYWALRKAGMPRRQTACRMVAFLVLLYAVYMLALMLDGILLRTGRAERRQPRRPDDRPGGARRRRDRRLPADRPDPRGRRAPPRRVRRRATGSPATRSAWPAAPPPWRSGTRTAIDFVRDPSRGGLAVLGAVGFWAANIGILWAAFHAYDAQVPLGVVVQGFFVGMVANLFPFAPGGVGAVDAGMIGTFVLFDVPGAEVFAAVLTYRLIAFWLPIPPGIVAFLQLRKTVARWEEQRAAAPVGPRHRGVAARDRAAHYFRK